MIDDFMKAILRRTLSEEIRNQMKWKQDDIKRDFPQEMIDRRDDNIKRIREFMEQNDIAYVD